MPADPPQTSFTFDAPQPPAPRADTRLKVTTWNVNGVRARAAEVQAFIERERPDVLCLQEIKASPENVPVTLRELPGYTSLWHGHKGYSGVALLVARDRFGAAPAFSHPSFDHETRIVVGEVEGFVFASTYVPNGNKAYPPKVAFLKALREWAREVRASGRSVVLCGDLNVALELRDVHPKLQDLRQTGQTPEEKTLLAEVIGEGLVDLGRRFAPDDNHLFTWWAPWRQMRERNIGWRLDYVLPDEALAEKATGCRVEREFGTSDHGPVTATFEL